MIIGKPIALLPLQIVLYIDNLYSWVYLLLELALFIYRGYTLNYSIVTIAFEVLGVFLLFLTQMFRLYLGCVGNKTEEITPLFYMILLTFLTTTGAIYYLRLQTYV